MNRTRTTAIGIAALALQTVMAGQITVLDQEYVHTGWHRQFSKAEMTTVPTAANKNDDCYFRFQIFEFTGQQNVTAQFQPCMFWNSIAEGTHACWVRNGAYSFKEPETRYIKRAMSTMWRYSIINWGNIMCFMLIDNAGTKGAAQARLRAEVIFVSPGEAIQVPDHWVEPQDWDACVDQGCKEEAVAVSPSLSRRGSEPKLFDVVNDRGQVVVKALGTGAGILNVFDAKGNMVSRHAVREGATLALGREYLAGAGVYVLRMSAGPSVDTRRVIVR